MFKQLIKTGIALWEPIKDHLAVDGFYQSINQICLSY